MIGIRPSRDPRPAAVLVRVTAFVVAAVSTVLVPSELAAAASGHLAIGTALIIAGAAVALTLATTAVARGLDPLRNA